MTHPVEALQGVLVGALRADTALAALVGNGVFDAPPKGRQPPYVTIARHDVRRRDGDLAPINEHLMLLHVLGDVPSRRQVLAIVERVLAVVLEQPLAPPGLAVSLREEQRLETGIDAKTGLARAAITLRLWTEPV